MMQIVEQSFEEKMKMYDKKPKKDLIKMLITCNNTIDSMIEQHDKQIRQTQDQWYADGIKTGKMGFNLKSFFWGIVTGMTIMSVLIFKFL